MNDITSEAAPDNTVANRLQEFVNRYEALEEEKKNISDDQKELLNELAGLGYEKRTFKKVIALRKRDPEDVAEEESILEMYLSALGMSR